MERDRPDAKGFGLIINLSLSSYKKIYFKKEENAVWANITHLRLRSGIFSALRERFDFPNFNEVFPHEKHP